MILTIGGVPGAGKSTIAKMLSEHLNLERHYVGGILREMAKERGMDVNEFYKLAESDPSIDHGLDEYQRKLGLEKTNILLEGRTSFHFIPHSIKIFLNVDLKEAARRNFEDSKINKLRGESYNSIEECHAAMVDRIDSEIKRYGELYGINHLDHSNYDIVIDTTNKSIQEVFTELVQAINSY